MMSITIAGTHRVSEAKAVTALLSHYPKATVRHFDLGPASRPDEIDATDIGRLAVIEALELKTIEWILAQGLTAPWHLVPMDARLEDATPGGTLYAGAGALYEWFRTTNVQDAKVSKLLHIKRPTFFPILDQLVRKLYEKAAIKAHAATSAAFKRDQPKWDRLFWPAIGMDVAENKVALMTLRDRLRTRSKGRTEQAVFARQLLQVTDLRLMDMIAWLICKRQLS
jgi:hypothetical protein